MTGWTLGEIAAHCGGALEGAPDPKRVVPIGKVSIDSRTIEKGAVFVAVQGVRDGHDFVADAGARGASAALVAREFATPEPTSLPLIRVDDPQAALWRWAEAHRAAMNARRIAVTGSSGKTTTKDRISEVLAADGPVHATSGNLNNQLGVPLTLLALRPEHRWSIVEIATNHPGEIEPLARLVRPDHLVLTTVGWAHVGAFGSREEILDEKLSALRAIASGGMLFHDADPWLVARLPRLAAGVDRLSFGLETEADCRPERLEWDW
ncbi:MAG: UDP-N-acetylmuramoylalanyl-D-glutamate--2,6-diaminopimelate ligase, partial [Candidatus Latescibacteria bacterium]|nr:UDP-N-acetylmuramoylalanyl-D-glutamate--2,6-diaminopimelate ligase [Candidatus Latescibacterota bacterium]